MANISLLYTNIKMSEADPIIEPNGFPKKAGFVATILLLTALIAPKALTEVSNVLGAGTTSDPDAIFEQFTRHNRSDEEQFYFPEDPRVRFVEIPQGPTQEPGVMIITMDSNE